MFCICTINWRRKKFARFLDLFCCLIGLFFCRDTNWNKTNKKNALRCAKQKRIPKCYTSPLRLGASPALKVPAKWWKKKKKKTIERKTRERLFLFFRLIRLIGLFNCRRVSGHFIIIGFFFFWIIFIRGLTRSREQELHTKNEVKKKVNFENKYN